MENTETVTITKIANGYQLTIHHDQSGSGYGCDLSEDAYQQLRLHFVVGRSEQSCKHPDSCSMGYYHQIDNYYCSKCQKTGLQY